jgi:hypothetical protein
MLGARVTSSRLWRASVFIGLGVRFPREVPTSSTCTVQRIVAGMFREDPMQHSLAAKVSDELESGIPCPPQTKGRNN